MADKDKSQADEKKPKEKRINPERRKQKDRRDMIRFEPDKEPRRSGKDRRGGGRDVWDDKDKY